MASFWHTLPKPFFVLAPMADVTDAAFRRLIAQLGKPDVFFTEFISADGLYHLREIEKVPDAKNPLLRELMYTSSEHPIVAQLFGGNPKTMKYATEFVATLGFDGIDINIGCPDRSVEKQGAGAALIKNTTQAISVIRAAQEGAARHTHTIPISVKTRIGYTHETIDEWIPALLSVQPAAITVHLRTRKEMSKVSAHWEYMEHIVSLRDKSNSNTLILGNGDVHDLKDAVQKAKSSGADGIMLGRAIFENPWLFSNRKYTSISIEERFSALTTLANFFEEIYPPKPFHIFRKHIKTFINGFPRAAEFRTLLMHANSADELTDILHAIRTKQSV